MAKLKLVKVDYKYCDYLRRYDHKVCYNKGSKELRPYIGVLLEINACLYFAPLSSPKEKYKDMPDNIDFIKIDEGNLGAINFNNMIPLSVNNYSLLDFYSKNLKYARMLRMQLRWLIRHTDIIIDHASNLYYKYIKGTLDSRIRSRCCNFPLLEEKCFEYNNLFINN